MKSDENKINRPKNKTTGAVLGLRTAPVEWDIGRGQEIPTEKI
jgi:hypothetical protein